MTEKEDYKVGDLWLRVEHDRAKLLRAQKQRINAKYKKWKKLGGTQYSSPKQWKSMNEVETIEDVPLVEEHVIIVDNEVCVYDQGASLPHPDKPAWKYGESPLAVQVVKVMDTSGNIKFVNEKSLRKKL